MNADQVRALVAKEFPEAMNSPLARAFASASEQPTLADQLLIAYDDETSRLRRAGLINVHQYRERVLTWLALDKALTA